LQAAGEFGEGRGVDGAVGEAKVAGLDRDETGVLAGQEVTANLVGGDAEGGVDLDEREAAGVEGQDAEEALPDARPVEGAAESPVAPFQEGPHRLDLVRDPRVAQGL